MKVTRLSTFYNSALLLATLGLGSCSSIQESDTNPESLSLDLTKSKQVKKPNSPKQLTLSKVKTNSAYSPKLTQLMEGSGNGDSKVLAELWDFNSDGRVDLLHIIAGESEGVRYYDFDFDGLIDQNLSE